MEENGHEALTPIWAKLREEVQQPEYWKKWNHGWDATKLLLAEPLAAQTEFVLTAVRRIARGDEKARSDYIRAVGKFLSRVMTGGNPALHTIVVSPRTIPLEEMSEKDRARYIEDRVNYALDNVLRELVRRRIELSDRHVVELLELYAPAPRRPPQVLLNYVLRLAEKAHLSPELRSALEKLRRGLGGLRVHKEQREQLQRIAKLLDDLPAYEAAKGPWLDMVFQETDALPQKELCHRIVAHAASAGNTLSKRWKEEAARFTESLGREHFRDAVVRWLGAGVTPGEARRQLKPGEAELLKGIVWMLSDFGDLNTASAVAALAEECFRKIPQIGAVSHKVGNACVNALAEMPGLDAVGQLSRLRARMKYSTAKRLVEKALNQAASRAGITRNDLEDIAVPTFDLELPGVLRRDAGTYVAELSVVGSAQTSISWTSAEGKRSKSVPTEVKHSHADVWKALKRTAKEAEGMLRAQRSRLEKLYLTDHSVRYEDWRKRTVDHPLLAQTTRRLIWQFEDAAGQKTLAIWHSGGMVGVDRKALDHLAGTTVRLWHPLGTSVDTVLAWRKWLEAHEVMQPFKQAHREIYVLTEAERLTETYSNRFAAHILSQHTLNALCRERGWENRLQGQFDSGGATPTLQLAEHGLVVEYWVAAPEDAPTSPSGISLYVTTDQVRFCDAHRVPMALERIAPLVFSEVMRDVDLFVGVASIASDPSWVDQGEHGPFGGYWHTWSFGELSATALMRREILEGLLPKLKIRERTKIEDKFLVVRGDRAIYKIHLGSGNVMMEPGSRYLCIVPGRNVDASGERAPHRIFLPFEGDNTLAIILSKAFLLAEDSKITDPTILRQLPN